MPQESSHVSGSPHRVVVIVDEGTNPFEVSVATELFGLPRPELGLARPLYELTLCAPAPDVRMNHGFFTMTGVAGLDAAEDTDTLVVPGRPDNVVPRTAPVRDAIRRAHARGARVVSFCTGSFALAEAGLLDGRRATTHWRWVDEFRMLHPEVLLEPDVLFVDEGDVLSSAG
ncbi:AraC family transcriptional regulator, partial [Streptomyces phyllanthi]